MTESPDAGTTQAPATNGNGGGNVPSNSDDTTSTENNGNGDGGVGSADTAADGAKLLAADVRRNQARQNALATGLQVHQDELEEAEADYEEARDSVDEDALRFAYVTLLDPVGLADQSSQVDTSGLGGFGASAGIVHAANVFGSDVQRAVAAMATESAPEPVTVIGLPQNALVDPDSLEAAKGGKGTKRDRNKDK